MIWVLNLFHIMFNDFTLSLKFKIIHSSSGHPQTQGLSEWINMSIKSSITTLAQEGYNFQQALMIHNDLYNTYHSFFLYGVFTCIPTTLVDFLFLYNIFNLFEYPNIEDWPYNYECYKYMTTMQQVHQRVFNNMKGSQHLSNRW